MTSLVREMAGAGVADARRASRFSDRRRAGSMVVSEQVDAMRALGTDPDQEAGVAAIIGR